MHVAVDDRENIHVRPPSFQTVLPNFGILAINLSITPEVPAFNALYPRNDIVSSKEVVLRAVSRQNAIELDWVTLGNRLMYSYFKKG
jgi:hypothetical protein